MLAWQHLIHALALVAALLGPVALPCSMGHGDGGAIDSCCASEAGPVEPAPVEDDGCASCVSGDMGSPVGGDGCATCACCAPPTSALVVTSALAFDHVPEGLVESAPHAISGFALEPATPPPRRV